VARLKTAALISGRGSNLEALLRACAEKDFPAAIALVLSNRADAGGLEHAARAGIASAVIPHRDYPSREAFETALTGTLEAAGIELICLAGFMRLLTASFVDRWRDRMINIHPSLLPAFPGLDTHRRALQAGVKLHGATVHVVTPKLDDGPIVVQGAVPVLADDTEDTLAARVLRVEHRIYPQAVRWFLEDRIDFTAGHVVRVRRAGAADDWIAAPRDLE
jgi:phosphoribosylglycinamide formyltransferase-1